MSPGPRAYVTYFDQHYLPRALVMLRSLRRHDPQAAIFALCFDQASFDVISGLGDSGILATSSEAVATFEPGLLACSDRSRWAFYGTHKPVLALYALNRRPELGSVACIDADTQFFASPAPLFDEIGETSIAVSPHRFSQPYEAWRKFGLYNAGFIHWRNDELGRRCLADYRADCLNWCEHSLEPDGRFMNQGYLNAWPERYRNVCVIRHPGVNLAWWNIASHVIAAAGDGVSVDGEPLIFCHFSQIVLDEIGIWRAPRDFGDNLLPALRAIYHPYLQGVERTERWLRRRGVLNGPAIKHSWSAQHGQPLRRGPWPRSVRGFLKRTKWSLEAAKRAERAEI